MKYPQTPLGSNALSPAFCRGGTTTLGSGSGNEVAPGTGVSELGGIAASSSGSGNEKVGNRSGGGKVGGRSDAGRMGSGLGLMLSVNGDGIRGGISDAFQELVSVDERPVNSIPGSGDGGESRLGGFLMLMEEGGWLAGPGLPLGLGVLTVISVVVPAEPSVFARLGAAIEIKETAPCEDRFFFSSSPVRHKGQ